MKLKSILFALVLCIAGTVGIASPALGQTFTAADNGSFFDPLHDGEGMDFDVLPNGDIVLSLKLGAVAGYYRTSVWLSGQGHQVANSFSQTIQLYESRVIAGTVHGSNLVHVGHIRLIALPDGVINADVHIYGDGSPVFSPDLPPPLFQTSYQFVRLY